MQKTITKKKKDYEQYSPLELEVNSYYLAFMTWFYVNPIAKTKHT